jgi:rhamnulokinase
MGAGPSLTAEAHLAVDLGAESGRVFFGQCRGGILGIEEIHRFPNRPITQAKSLHWDVWQLWSEVCRALSRETREIASVGVDAWGVDYALLDERGELLENPHHYRDPRNPSAMEEALRVVSKEEIYRETGAQFLPINTLYQLYAAGRDNPELLASARRMVMIPDLFHYWLSGNALCEYTAASTTQFANPKTRCWANDLLAALGLPAQLPAQIVEPGSFVGDLHPYLLGAGRSGARVIAPASHDTASAVAAIPANGSTAFVSSGTWSLVGIELDAPIVSPEAMRMNFTNEGGVAGTTRVLKNVMGLWMLQGCRSAWNARGREFNYGDLTEAARSARAFQHLVNPDHADFLNPADMLDAMGRFCRRTDQPVPDSPGAHARAVMESLALKYRFVIHDLETLVGRSIERIRVIGGGSKNSLLNQFTADATGKQVVAGPAEASVLGNLGVQMWSMGEIGSLDEVRALIDRSFPAEVYEPRDTDCWDREASKFQQYCELN